MLAWVVHYSAAMTLELLAVVVRVVGTAVAAELGVDRVAVEPVVAAAELGDAVVVDVRGGGRCCPWLNCIVRGGLRRVYRLLQLFVIVLR